MPVTLREPLTSVPGARALGEHRKPLSHRLSPAYAAMLPLACAAALAATGAIDNRHNSPALRWSILAAAAALAAGSVILFASARRSGRWLAIEVVARRQHYL